MSAAMWAGHGAGRWAAAAGLALTAHLAVLLMAASWRDAVIVLPAPPPTVMIDLAPLPSAPSAASSRAAEVPPPPSPPVFLPPLTEAPPPVSEAELAARRIQPKPKPIAPKPVQPKPLPPQPVRSRAEPSPSPPAPALPQAVVANPGATDRRPPSALPTWQGILVAHLERHKRYPRAAQFRRQQGIVQLRFSIDRAGNVLSHTVERSSGIAVLDEEALRMVARAQPFPVPPEQLAGERFDFTVPVQFDLR